MKIKNKKILVFGVSPLPIEKDEIAFGPGLRTWHLIKPLIERGYEICLVTARTKGAYAGKKFKPLAFTEKYGFTWYSLDEREFENVKNLQKIYDKTNPWCVIAVGSILVRYCIAKLKMDKPVWMDLFGNVLIEAQAKANLLDNNNALLQAYNSEKEALFKGDMFSVVSNAQKFATVGELGMLGRLDKRTFGYEFVREIPCAVEPLKKVSGKQKILRGKLVKKDDFVILWNAGYNTWCDVDTLFRGLELAMNKNNKIKFVSIGGPIYGHDEKTYKTLCGSIEKSTHKGNYLMLDWVDIDKVPVYYSESDIGINIDKPCYEALTGSRNRILSGLISGLPFLSTNICELTQELKKEGVLFTFKEEDPDDLSKALLSLSRSRHLIKNVRERAKNIVKEKYSFEQTAKELVKWVERPCFAPDRGNITKTKASQVNTKIYQEHIGNLERKIRILEEDTLSKDRRIIEFDKVRKDKDNAEKAMLELRNYTDTLRSEIRGLDERNKKFTSELKDFDIIKKEKDALSAEFDKVRKDKDNAEKAMLELRDYTDNLRREIKDLDERNRKLVQEAKDLRSLNLRLDAGKIKKERDLLKDKVIDLNTRYLDLRKNARVILLNAKNDGDKLTSEIDSLKKQIKLLEEDVVSKNRHLQEFDKVRKDKDNAEKAMLELRDYTDNLRNEIKSLDERNRKLLTEINKVSSENKKFTSELKDFDIIKKEKDALSAEFDKVRKDKDNAEKAMLELRDYTDNLRNEISGLQDKIAGLGGEITGLNQKNRDISVENINLIKENHGLNQNISALNREKNDLKEKADSLAVENINLTKEKHELNRNISMLAAEKGDLSEKLKNSTVENINLSREKIEFGSRLKQVESLPMYGIFIFISKALLRLGALFKIKIDMTACDKAKDLCGKTGMCLLYWPLVKILRLLFAIEGFIWLVSGFTHIKGRQKSEPVVDSKISLVIPNLNSADYLIDKCLPALYKAEGFRELVGEIIVIDDASTDNSVGRIKSEFKEIRIIKNRKTLGFNKTCNIGIKKSKNDLVLLLNTDIIVSEGFLKHLSKHFKDSDVYAAVPKVFYWDKKSLNIGMNMGRFEPGYLRIWNEKDMPAGKHVDSAVTTLYAVGGVVLFDKRKFIKMGMFDGIYEPFNWEDIDVSYRALKRGWQVIYEPDSVVYHKQSGTMKRCYSRNFFNIVERKNELLFMWKNITDKNMIDEHLELLFKRLFSDTENFRKGFLWAFSLILETMIRRLGERRHIVKTDKEILGTSISAYKKLMSGDKSRARKHILIISPFLPYPLNQGGKIRMHTIARLLKDKYDFSVLAYIDSEDELKYIPELKKVFKEVYAVLKTPTPMDWKESALYPVNYRFYHSRVMEDKMKEILDREAVDIVQIESEYLMYLAKEIRDQKVIFVEHDTSVLTLNRSYIKAKLSLLEWCKRLNYHNDMLRFVDDAIVLSRKDKSVMAGFMDPERIHIVPTGIDVERFKPSDSYRKNSAPVLVFVGHYLHFPNEDAMAYFARDIFPLITGQMRDVRLKIVGSNPTAPIKGLAKAPNIEVIGEVSDVRPYLEEALLYVCPVRLGGGIKTKVAEAMAMGLPVVATPAGADGIEARHNEGIIIAKSPRQFAAEVIRLLRAKDIRLKIALNSRKIAVEKYDWKKIIKKFDGIY